jgi:GAF domain-containing protein/anti-sigma regulatory factor (Ser/Thr protein kinase)
MKRESTSAKAANDCAAPAGDAGTSADGVRIRALEEQLAEALEQQGATAEILRVISATRTDLKPVFEAIVRSAVRLCRADFSFAARFDGVMLHPLAHHGFSPAAAEIAGRIFPMRPSMANMLGRAVLKRTVVNLPDMLADPDYSHEFALAGGWRSGLAVPMLRDGEMIGAIAVARTEPGAFPDHHVALLQTFADQAVIAVENVRLFDELETRNRDLTESLEQQAATSEVLRVISRSPTDVQPVFETIAAASLKLCGGSTSLVATYDGELVRAAAFANVEPEAAEGIHRTFPRPPGRDNATTRAVDTRRVAMIPDILEDPEYTVKENALLAGFRSIVSVPLLRDGDPIGAITVGRPDPGPFAAEEVGLLRTFADQAVIAIENVRLFNELADRNRALTEALEHQTATSAILRVISRSPNDIQPVFEIIGERAEKLCDAQISLVTRVEGDYIQLGSYRGASAEAMEVMKRQFPMPFASETATGRAVRRRAVVHLADIAADPDYGGKEPAAVGGWRSCLAVPMLRDEQVIGAIFVGRRELGPFPESKIELLKTFADQAVIAVENVRLFNETREALERQTATSEILRVISGSPGDIRPVFETVVHAAARLCRAPNVLIVRCDGDVLRGAAAIGPFADVLRGSYGRIEDVTIPLVRGTVSGRAAIECRTIHVHDLAAERDDEYPVGRELAHRLGHRTMLATPLVRDGTALGAICLFRSEIKPFSAQQIALLASFADQAVIAIENVRLFTELGARNRDLTEALEQQTATSEVLKVISESKTDAQPVFETIASAALRLCRAAVANVMRLDDDTVRIVALANASPEGARKLLGLFPRPLAPDTGGGRAILARDVVTIPDVLIEPGYAIGETAHFTGYRSTLSVPLVRGESAIGAINVGRFEAGPFPEKQVLLLRTFANQAMIAIENVRLFRELEARTHELTQSVGELEALGEVGQAVSSTLDLGTVLSTIVTRATQLAGLDGGAIYEYDETREEFHLHATEKLPAALVDTLRATPIRKGEGGVLGKMAISGEPAQVGDIADERIYRSRVRKLLIDSGYRALLAVPLLRDERLLGGIVVNRNTPGEFAAPVIALLKTFASQSALAIQNARLFREIADKGRELEAASRHKSEFLANMSHELRTPLNAIIGFSEVLAERMFGEINDKQSEYVGDILESGRHLLSLINDILDLSKIEAGRMELDRSDFDLPAAVDNALTLVRERAGRHGIALVRAVDPRLGAVNADERKVKQVLLNLLTNALKFTPEGGEVAVRAGVADGMAQVAVTDTGVGIAPQDLEAVFEEFRQVGAAEKKVEGTGLGLPISRKIIELHGGRLWATSVPGNGSTFTFTLPVRGAGGGTVTADRA